MRSDPIHTGDRLKMDLDNVPSAPCTLMSKSHFGFLRVRSSMLHRQNRDELGGGTHRILIVKGYCTRRLALSSPEPCPKSRSSAPQNPDKGHLAAPLLPLVKVTAGLCGLPLDAPIYQLAQAIEAERR